MLLCVRTTLRLDDELLREAKRYAAKNDMTLTSLMDRALRETLSKARHTGGSEAIELPTFDGRGLQPGIDLDDAATLLELMESGDDSS